MFKKSSQGSSKPKKGVLRKRLSSESDDDEIAAAAAGPKKEGAGVLGSHGDGGRGKDEDESLRETILNTKKKRKLITSLQYRRGVDAVDLLTQQQPKKAHGQQQDSGDDSDNDNDDSTKLGPLSQSVLGASVETSKEGILKQKHQQAMEEFIRQNIGQQAGDNIATNAEKTTKPASAEEELYRELAESAAALVGKTIEGNNVNQSAGDDGESSGAVLVGGTGITEVLLPVSERLKTVQETERARIMRQQQYQRQRGTGVRDGGGGITAESLIASTTTLPNRTLSDVRTFVPNRFSVPSAATTSDRAAEAWKHSNEAVGKRKPLDSADASVVDEDGIDNRPGFEGRRRGGGGGGGAPLGDGFAKPRPAQPSRLQTDYHQKPRQQDGGNNYNRDRSSDDRVYKNFITKQRESGFKK